MLYKSYTRHCKIVSKCWNHTAHMSMIKWQFLGLACQGKYWNHTARISRSPEEMAFLSPYSLLSPLPLLLFFPLASHSLSICVHLVAPHNSFLGLFYFDYPWRYHLSHPYHERRGMAFGWHRKGSHFLMNTPTQQHMLTLHLPLPCSNIIHACTSAGSSSCLIDSIFL